ncbi:23S rRNA (adenine(2503)-C(2))-methyltransferase RlmN [Patescibacteria group bacterium]|nr:23S rRNA (adenine(2503)-C(2))-methyltransferase RlmN [Patescibacteria group bacterium]MBU4162337.1 23S rRNA (adenine(2503)-C(2))-methyltransferase RlmN [Patescibacteria group bacterium]
MDLNVLEEILKNEPEYRLKQTKKAIFSNLIENWDQATVIPSILREKLKRLCPLEIIGKIYHSKDKCTSKALIVLIDKEIIETVLIRHEDGRKTVCVSSQVGCPLGCVFCATGQRGFTRNLTASEIIEQVLFWNRYLQSQNEKVTNIVFMGMGEPFLNYDEVMAAIRIINEKHGFGVAARKISVSTVGLPEQIKKFSEEGLQINLAISLHATNDDLRTKLMPINKKYQIKEILSAVDYYIKKTNRKVMFEYLMIDNVTDSEKNAHELVALLDKPLYMVNLISYNQTDKYKPSSKEKINKFKKILRESGINVIQRFKFGQDIKGACGQLMGRALLK